MIVNFAIENFLSFKNAVTTDFESSREKFNSDHLATAKKIHKKISPIACFFGPNASGKTNWFKALKYLKSIIVNPQPDGGLTNVTPYKLDTFSENNPTKFQIEFLSDKDDLYKFTVELNSKKILFEALSVQNSQGINDIYIRKEQSIQFFNKNKKAEGQTKFALNLLKSSLKDNQLILNAANSNLWSILKNIGKAYEWFNKLVLISPDTGFLPIFTAGTYEPSIISKLLSNYGIDVDNILLNDFPLENLPEDFKKELSNLDPTKCFGGFINDKDFVLASINEGKVKVQKLCTIHNIADDNMVSFDFSSESDGTRRLIELFPILLALSSTESKNFVFLIDELDRSLHTLLTKKIVETFIKLRTPEMRTQLIFSCHDFLMLDHKVLRLDQMFIFSKQDSYSVVNKFNTINGIRTDKDLLKFYLEGKLGGIPKIKTQM